MTRRGTAAVLLLAVFGAMFLGVPAASADPNDFTVTSFDADYYLDRSDDGRSTLRTVETIVAEFPDFDQNHGLLRDLVEYYHDQPTDLWVESVVDAKGQEWPYETDSEDGYLILQIGDSDEYVHGTQTFVITYTQKNVTGYFPDDGNEQFYWDVNGTEWQQAFGEVTGRVHVSAALAEDLDGTTACYRGSFGSHDSCDSESATSEGDYVYTAAAADLQPYETLTFAIGFEEGTFVPRDNSPWASPFFYLELFFALVAVIVGIVALVLAGGVFANGRGRPTIVAEYLPPKDFDVMTSAVVMRRSKRAVAAQLIDLAVRHNIRIVETPTDSIFSSKPEYSIEFVTAEGLRPHEESLLRAFFSEGLEAGATKTLEKKDSLLATLVYNVMQSVTKKAQKSALYKKVPTPARVLLPLFGLSSGIFTIVLFVFVLADGRGGLLPLLLLLPAIAAAIVALAVAARRPLSERGAELRDYLKGLELYIRVAEVDRIRMLQSPEGAERGPIDTSDRSVMLKLYERVLPYAVLFNLEEEWAKQLGTYYDEQPPEWYSGTGTFNTFAFATGISSLSSTASAGYSGTSSSSSGGSGGGGSSGGGGGGGGGGGW